MPPATLAATPRRGFERREWITFALVAAGAIVALALRAGDVSPPVVFAVAAVAVAGLAYVLGDATEQAGEAAGSSLAALLNATFGNLPELVIVVLTIHAGLIDVARASIVGSVLGNVLFILGFSIIVGGLRHGTMRFDSRVAGVNASMLVLAVVTLGVPTLASRSHAMAPHEQRTLSYLVAGVMVVLYGAYLAYSFRRPAETGVDGPGGARWTARGSIMVLAVTAVATGVVSEVLVDAIKPTIERTGIGATFIGLIIVPFVGNVAEHLAAVRIAWGGDLAFSMGIAFNSGLQVSLGVTAIAVFAGGLLGHDLVLVFPAIEIALLAVSAVMAGMIAADGEVNWLEGAELIAIYAVAAVSFWFL